MNKLLINIHIFNKIIFNIIFIYVYLIKKNIFHHKISKYCTKKFLQYFF